MTTNKDSENFIPRDTILGERYRIIAIIGSGGMATVYEAHDMLLKKRVALKVLESRHLSNEELRKRFYHEARAVSQLDHQNIVRVFDVEEFFGNHCMVMELVQGENLESLIRKEGQKEEFIGITKASQIIECVLEALCHSHSRGIIHRDIKPSNIMISSSGEVKITDLGIAKVIEYPGNEPLTLLTKDLAFTGTPQYMSPEQITGMNITGKTDVFSAGIVFYELLTGRLPFDNVRGQDLLTALTNILNKRVKSPRKINKKIPAELEDILLKSLEKNPEKRYDSTGFKDAITHYLRGEKVSVEGKFLRRINMNRREFIIKAGIGATAAILGTAVSISHLTRYLEYENSMESTIHKIGLSKDWKSLRLMLETLNDQLYDRFSWIDDTEFGRIRDYMTGEKHPEIYPFGTQSSPGKEGMYFYFSGEGSTAGFIIPMYYYAFENFKQRSRKTGSKTLIEKSRHFLDCFFHYAKNLYYAENDATSLVMDRFYYPARIIQELEREDPEIALERQNEIRSIYGNYALALKMIIEARFNPSKGFIERSNANTPDNKNMPDAQKDFRIASALCEGLQILDLERDVFSIRREGISNRITSVEEYIRIIMTDGDSKIEALLNRDTGESSCTGQDYTSLLLGIAYRRMAITNILAIRGHTDREKTKNRLMLNANRLDEKALAWLAKKKDDYDDLIKKMMSQYIRQTSPDLLGRYYLTRPVSRENPIDNISTLRFLESAILTQPLTDRDQELQFRIIKSLAAKEYLISGRTPVSAERPCGFIRGASFNLKDLKGMTYIETDYLFLKTIRTILNNTTK